MFEVAKTEMILWIKIQIGSHYRHVLILEYTVSRLKLRIAVKASIGRHFIYVVIGDVLHDVVKILHYCT